ncbi:MAG: hypothetical protein KDA63_21000 [Planctomycetales bacterium]|nr:hypothetical protein [Planctomycetales bacterium]
MLGNANLWDAAQAVHAILAAAGVSHGIVGGVAVCLHGYRRNTVDVDLLIRPDDADAVRSALEAAGWVWDGAQKEFRTPSGVAIQFLYAGRRAGAGSQVLLPDPADATTLVQLEDLPVVTLARLIESKIACGEGSPRRTHRDFADVVELIAIHNLDATFARHLDKSLRKTYRVLARHARDE